MTAPRRPIPIAKVCFGEEERAAVLRPLEAGWVVQGPEVAAFEQSFGAFTGAAHAIAVSNGSTALHLACRALGAGPGDEVIVPAFTWVSTANAPEHCGARAVFCDVDLHTFNLRVDHLEALVGPRTVGIIPVHLFGLPADMDGVMAVARKHGLWVVEDAACALGAYAGAAAPGNHVGTRGALGCFSFHPRKSITTGEGGMLTTNDAALAARCRSLRNHGASSARTNALPGSTALLPEYDELGFNFRMTDLQGALGRAQMARLPGLLAARREVAAFYDQRLAPIATLALPRVPPGLVHGYQSYVTLLRDTPGETPTLAALPALERRRNAMIAALEDDGIGTRQGTHAPVRLSVYRDKYGLRPEDHPNAHLADAATLALPIYPGLTRDEIDDVAAGVARAAAL